MIIIQWVSFAQSLENYELAEINFEGNKSFSSLQLRGLLLSEESPMWLLKFANSFTSFGSPPVYFDSSKIPVDLEALSSFYHNHGFFKARFSYHYNIDTTDKEVTLVYRIFENEPSIYRTINLHNLSRLDSLVKKNFTKIFEVDANERFNQDEIQERIDEGIVYLKNNGFMNAKLDKAYVDVDTLKNFVDVNIIFNTGNFYRIDSLKINKIGEGKDIVSSNLIREITFIKEGEIYNQDLIRRREARLIRTELFNSLNILPASVDSSANNVSMVVNAEIGKVNEIAPEYVINNELNYLNTGIGATYKRKNFLGDARRLTLEGFAGIFDLPHFNFSNLFKKPADRDTTFQGYAYLDLKLEQPYFFGKSVFTTLATYYEAMTLQEYNIYTYGANLNLDIEMPQYTFINLLKPYYNLEFGSITLKDVAYLFGEEEDIPEDLKIRLESSLSVIGIETGTTRTDDPFFPAAGYYLNLISEAGYSSEELFIGFSVENEPVEYIEAGKTFFYRTQLTSAFFTPLNSSNSSVFASKVRIGHLQSFIGDEEWIAFSHTFYAGGSNSVRGWRAKKLVPVTSLADSVEVDTDIRGGNFLLEGSIELRNKYFDVFGITFFADFGNTWNSYKYFRFDDVALAAGFGFRYYSPFAPFRLDFGFKLYDPYKKKFLWQNWDKKFMNNLEFHFGIGEAF